ncbi:MAG: methionyl-tRNA formyltransferase [Gammaproteobacteria bacterium]|nr:methionyl-tRNA formyltransferase [Gammaproteobacteria bacterium]
MSAAKLLFAGTPDFALASLMALVESGHIPDAVLTQPDRPAGRGKKLTASPVKEFALSEHIPVWQPESLKDPQVVANIVALEPDLFVVAAYGLLLPQEVLDIPKKGCLNVHASLLPRWRGAAPIQHAILNGDKKTGVCLMQMEAGLDTGPVYVSAITRIKADESAGDLHDRLAWMGGELLNEHLDDIVEGRITAEPQDESLATYAGKIRKQDAYIDWNRPALDIQRQVRAYNPAPGASFGFGDERVKCWKSQVVDGVDGPAGLVVNADKDGVDVACGEGGLRLLEVQRPGRSKISAAEFAGQSDLSGIRLD